MFVTEVNGNYTVKGEISKEEILAMAQAISRRRFRKGSLIDSASKMKKELRTLMQDLEHETFSVLFLTNQHRVIKLEEMFRGTINVSAVYPREVVKAALKCNAGVVAFVHNHPGGNPEPSRADDAITSKLKAALDTVDIRVLDHIIVGHDGEFSYAEAGKI